MRSSSSLKVCFLAGTLGRGGAERQLSHMLRSLIGAGVETRVICLTKGEPFEHEIRALGVDTSWVGESPYRPFRLKHIIKELRREPAHILQSTHFYTNLYAGMAARAVGIKDIGAVRSNLSSELKCNGLMGWGHFYLPRHLITNSNLARLKAIKLGISSRRIDFVPNAVEQPGGRKVTNEKHKPICILFAGRLTSEKRPDRFLRVVSQTMQACSEMHVKAVIAGDGPLKPHLKELAQTLGLSPDKLEFLGELADINSAYQEADILMLTSDWEGTPNVLLEAMAYGLPVIATRVGGVPEIVDEGRGFVTEPSDESGLVAAAIRLIGDSDLRRSFGERGREYVSKSHSIQALGKRLISTYERVLAG